MLDLLDQIDAAAHIGCYYLAFQSAIALPDICGALESPDGAATKQRFIAWFDKWMGPIYTETRDPKVVFAGALPPNISPDPVTFMSGEQAYFLRCPLLHQFVAQPTQANHTHPRIVFFEPVEGGTTIHRGVVWNSAPPLMYTINIARFCGDMTGYARKWLAAVHGSADFQKNYGRVLKRHPNGLAPLAAGMPVIG